MASLSPGDDLKELLAPYAGKVEAALRVWLDAPAVPEALAQAMRYASLDGGKRLRAALVVMSAETAAEPDRWRADPLPAAVAVELVHAYSLVHDDLPAMDNDALRRGRPTAHVRYGEAMAILVGDALLTRAFEVICAGLNDGPLAAPLVRELASAAGPAGMVAGQVADMGLCPVPPGDEGLRFIHLRKTGALIRGAVRMGAVCAGADGPTLTRLGQFGEKLGLAFQVTDDLLDATAEVAALGKTPGKDAGAGKRSYANELGVQRTGQLAGTLAREAGAALDTFGPRAAKLRTLTLLLARRDR